MKKIISFLMALLIMISAMPMSLLYASAASAVPSGAKEYNGHTYYVFKSEVTWSKAKKYCENRGGHLATITSQKENDFVSSLIEKRGITNCWLGATDKEKEGTWKWVTGEKFKYTSWASDQPDGNSNNGAEHYLGTYRYRDEWNDYKNDASDVQGYVCEWDMTKSKASAVRLKDTSATVYYKDTVTLKVLNTEKTVTWSSSNTKIAKVSSKGVVTGVSLGSCTITAKVGSKTLKCKITVKDRNSSATAALKVKGGGYFIKGESTAVAKFKLKSYDCAKVYAYIKNSNGDTVYKKTLSKVKKGEYYSFTWNGKNSDGEYVSSGSYRLLIKAGEKKSYSPYLTFKTKNEFSDGNGSKSNPFIVASTTQLKKIVKYPTAYFKQSKDLDFNYTSVGGFFSEDQPFNGVYDGNGKTIKNISSNVTLFDCIGEKGTIKNLKIIDCVTNGTTFAGAVLAYRNNGVIKDCTIDADIAVTETDYGLLACSGIVVVFNGGTISNTTATGSLYTAHEHYDRGINLYTGGIVGRNGGRISDCYSDVDISVAERVYQRHIGGIAGDNGGVIINSESKSSFDVFDGDYCGGIAGDNRGQIISSSYTGSDFVNLTGKNTGVIK